MGRWGARASLEEAKGLAHKGIENWGEGEGEEAGGTLRGEQGTKHRGGPTWVRVGVGWGGWMGAGRAERGSEPTACAGWWVSGWMRVCGVCVGGWGGAGGGGGGSKGGVGGSTASE